MGVATTLDRVRRGFASDVRFPMFDRRALPAYALCAFVIVTGTLLVIVRGYSFDPAILLHAIPTMALFLVAGYCARRIGIVQMAGWFESSALTAAFGIFSTLLFCPLLGMSLPFADTLLAKADALLGFHWPDAARWVSERPSFTLFLAFFYKSLMWQPAGVLALLFITNRHDRGWQLVTAGMIVALMCGLGLFLLPAAGPVIHFGITPTGLFEHSQWQAGPTIIRIKEGYRVIDDAVAGGLVSVPSFHTAAALMFIWATWPTKFRLPFLLLNVGQIVSTVVIGAHYLIDVLAGLAAGTLSLWLTGFAIKPATAKPNFTFSLLPPLVVAPPVV
jgi:membrane-associated phospholipid phosphatase